MLLSRFWIVLLGLLLGSTVFLLSMAQSMYNRAGDRSRGEGLSSDSQVVSWYLKDDARMRSAQLVKFALDSDIAKTLEAASKSETKLPSKYRDTVNEALKKVNATIEKEEAFDAVFAVDQHGRVVGHLGYPQANGMDDFELGGYPVVADALHGFIRDDTLVWGRTYRVVARPVQTEAGQPPAGAVIGARVLDDSFARELSMRTGAAVAFYVNGSRTAAGAPEGFNKSNLDQIVSDLGSLADDADYTEKGRSGIRELAQTLSVQYTKLPGEAYELGAGYVVARESARIESPFAFFAASDDVDKANANKLLAAAALLGALAIGLMLTYLEHSLPLRLFRGEASRLAKGESDQLHPSKFRGIYRKIAADLNEGIDKVAAATGGQSRRATNLEDVLGGLPAQPQMAAFAVPGGDFSSSPLMGGGATPAPGSAGFPSPPAANRPLPTPPSSGQGPRPPSPGGMPVAAPTAQATDPEQEWKAVFESFVSLKQQCGEPTEGLTYSKFRTTLVKNRDALVARHGVTQVKFAVHVKDGKAALKASPIKG